MARLLLRVFSLNIFPQAPDDLIIAILNFLKICEDNRNSRGTTGVNNTAKNGENAQKESFFIFCFDTIWVQFTLNDWFFNQMFCLRSRQFCCWPPVSLTSSENNRRRCWHRWNICCLFCLDQCKLWKSHDSWPPQHYLNFIDLPKHWCWCTSRFSKKSKSH